MKNGIFLILGESGSGKDTLGNFIAERLDYELMKFSAPCKRFWEKVYQLPKYSLDDRQFREQERLDIYGQPAGETYLDVLVKSYHNFLDVDPQVMIRLIELDILTNQQKGRGMVFTDVRTKEELDFLLTYWELVPFSVIHIKSKRSTKLSSDLNLERNLEVLKGYLHPIVMENNGTIEALQKTWVTIEEALLEGKVLGNLQPV